MKTTVLILVLLANSLFAIAQSPDFEKLATACRAWGAIKYFHPDQPSYTFDSAFAAQVPMMLKSTSNGDWKQAFQNWLTVLDDPTTRLVDLSSDSAHSQPVGHHKEFINDSTLLIKIDGVHFFNDYFAAREFLQSAFKEAKRTQRIVFDLRQSSAIPPDYQGAFSLYFKYFDINEPLATNPAPPYYRSVYYSGFVPERGGSSGGYSKDAILKNLPKAISVPTEKITTVWITNALSELPDIAVAEQAVGNAFVVHDSEDLLPLLPLTMSLPFTDRYILKFRTRNIWNNGRMLPTADTVYQTSDDVLTIAQQLLSNPPADKSARDHQSVPTVAEPDKRYPVGKLPSVGYRVLAAAKIFTIIDHFFPYHEYMDRNWYEVFVDALPAFVAADDEVSYGQAVARMYANIQDSHGFMSGNAVYDTLRGEAPAPMAVDFVEDQIVVTGFYEDSICRAEKIAIGDVVLRINGTPVEHHMKEQQRYYAHSTPQAINYRLARQVVRGPEGEKGIFTIQDSTGSVRDIELYWRKTYQRSESKENQLDTLALITDQIGYADLTRMMPAQTDAMFEKFKNTKAIIFDMRGYPNGTAWSIAPHLTEDKDVPLALFRRLDVHTPRLKTGEILGSRTYSEFIQTIPASDQPEYAGKTVMLINHNAVSQSEHTGLFFKSVDSTTFIGTPTMGANGDVTNFEIPGGMFLSFSGQGVWHTDGRQLQRLGLQPDVLVVPTIKGVRRGEDEILDRAIEWIRQNVE